MAPFSFWRKIPLLLVACLPAFFDRSIFAEQPFIFRLDLFPAGLNNVELYRIPGIVVTPKGTALAYCEARLHDKSDWGEIQVHLRRSSDGGRQWEAPRQIAHFGERLEGNPKKPNGGEHEQTVNNPVAIVNRQTGQINLLYCVNYARCFSIRSLDEGVTWSKPVDITDAFQTFKTTYDWNVIATGPGHGIQLKTGRLVVPIWLAYGTPGDHHPSATATLYSDNNGETWQAGEIAIPNSDGFGNPNETAAAELSDGRVMLVTRSVSKPSRKLVTISPNGADGWSEPKFHEQLWEPICMASIVAMPQQPGSLIFSGPRSLARNEFGNEIAAGRGKRRNLSIQLSHDDGRTWPILRTLDTGPSAYSDLAILNDETVLCLYEADQKISLARFNLDWLDE